MIRKGQQAWQSCKLCVKFEEDGHTKCSLLLCGVHHGECQSVRTREEFDPRRAREILQPHSIRDALLC